MESLNKVNISLIRNSIVAVIILAVLTIPFFFEMVYLLPVVIFGIGVFAYLTYYDFIIPHLHFVYLLITLSILTPPINVSSALPYIRLDEMIIYGFFPFILLLNINNLSLSRTSKQFVWIYASFIFLAIFSTLHGYLRLGVPASMRDLFEIVTISKYLLIFLTISSFEISLRDLKKLLYFILGVILLSGFYGLLQFFGIFGLDTLTGELFLQDRVHILHKRLTATYKNPNTYAAILITGHLIALGLFFFEDKKFKKVLLLLCIASFSVLLLFAGSRTMIAAYFLVTIIMALIGAYKAGFKTSQIIILLIILGFGFISAVTFVSYEIIVRLQSGLDILSDESFGVRIFVWYLNILIYLDSPIIGWGPAKDLHTTVVDGEFIFMLRKYGAIGLLTFLTGFYLHPLRIAYKNFKNSSKIAVLFSSIVFTVIITYLIAGLTNSLYHDSQVMDFWVIFLTLFYITLSEKGENDTIQ